MTKQIRKKKKTKREPFSKSDGKKTTLCGWCNKEIVHKEMEEHLKSVIHQQNKEEKEKSGCKIVDWNFIY